MRFMNLGGMEVFVILLLAILAIGPKETAKWARQANEVIKNVKDMLNDLTSEVGRAVTEVTDAVDDQKPKE